MTKKEAIELLEDLYGAIEDNHGRDYDEAFRMAIEALSADRPQGVGRYENAMQKLREMPKYLNGIKVKQIKKISTNTVQGEWIDIEIHCNPYPPLFCVECSRCGYRVDRETFLENTFSYCPSCGARMKGGDIK